MSLECRECERDLRGGHDLDCSRHPSKRAPPPPREVPGVWRKSEDDNLLYLWHPEGWPA